MKIRYPAHPKDFRNYTTEQLRSNFLIERLFEPGQVHLVYSHVDRVIVGGVCPQCCCFKDQNLLAKICQLSENAVNFIAADSLL